jgi:hypothetical protein
MALILIINYKNQTMELPDILIIFLIALLITVIFTMVFKNRGPWGLFWLFFLIVFLASWSARLWISPLGPMFLGVAWVPILIVAIIFALILAATAIPPKNPRKEIIEKQIGVTTDEGESSVAFGAFFWVLLIILAVAVIVGYAIKHLPV